MCLQNPYAAPPAFPPMDYGGYGGRGPDAFSRAPPPASGPYDRDGAPRAVPRDVVRFGER